MLTASAVFSLLVATSAAPPLQVEIASPKTRLFIYEPVKLTVRATAVEALVLPSTHGPAGSPAVETWIDYGDGFAEYVEVDQTAGVAGALGGEQPLARGDSLVKTVVLVEGRTGDNLGVPFPVPGHYALRIVFRGRPEGVSGAGVTLGESNAVSFEIVAPDPDAQRLVERIQSQPWILRGGLDNPQFDSLLNEFPASPYLDWGKRAAAVEEAHRIHNGRYPDSGEKFASMGQGSPLAPPLYRQLAIDLMNVDTWGQFDEERLQLAAENMERAGSMEAATEIWREILERFPGSAAADEAMGRIDSTPPSLDLMASPSSLWPPNHRLEPVSVSVEVSDDQDPSPVVSLVSIVCDDACEPAADIVDAAYGTDDRQFRLRSERRGGSAAGRTYTITYSATDASGNTATATTTVIVSHDRARR